MKKRILLILITLCFLTSCGGAALAEANLEFDRLSFCVIDGKVYTAGPIKEGAVIPDHPKIAGYITRQLDTSVPFRLTDDSWNMDGIEGIGYPYCFLSDQEVMIWQGGGWTYFSYYSDVDDFTWKKGGDQ